MPGPTWVEAQKQRLQLGKARVMPLKRREGGDPHKVTQHTGGRAQTWLQLPGTWALVSRHQETFPSPVCEPGLGLYLLGGSGSAGTSERASSWTWQVPGSDPVLPYEP